MEFSRRTLLRSGAAASIVASLPLSTKVAFGAGTDSQGIVVLLMMRGAMDGLNLLAPADDVNLIAARPATIRPFASGTGAGFALANGPSKNDWRLNANAAALRDLYNSGNLAFVHASGPSYGGRSHFQMQSLLERGISDPSLEGKTAGWISRYASQGAVTAGTFSMVSSAPEIPVVLQDPASIFMPSPGSFSISSVAKQTMLQASYGAATGSLAVEGQNTLSAVTAFHTLATGYTDSTTAGYGKDSFSQGLKVIAELIKLKAGLQMAEVEYSDWDHHVNEASRFTNSVTILSNGLGAFWNDLTASGVAGNVTLIGVSEFGRRVKSNASGGTDHGHGTATMVLGSKVKGGKIYGKWLGLDPSVLVDGDVPVTTDQRAIMLEVLNATRGNVSSSFFPGLPAYTPLGLI